MSWQRIAAAAAMAVMAMAVVVTAQSPRVPSAVVGEPGEDPGPQVGVAGELMGFSGRSASGSQTITLVHAGKLQIAVYHIDGSGQIHLVSSRPISDDFSITLNPTEPLPGQIRPMTSQVR
ncbi:MAG: hypothetical protein AAF802_04655 [Planctomycetota bacterium]